MITTLFYICLVWDQPGPRSTEQVPGQNTKSWETLFQKAKKKKINQCPFEIHGSF